MILFLLDIKSETAIYNDPNKNYFYYLQILIKCDVRVFLKKKFINSLFFKVKLDMSTIL